MLDDVLAVEEPLEIPLDGRSVSLRTPGEDDELAVDFLFSEGMIRDAVQIRAITRPSSGRPSNGSSNIVKVELTTSHQLTHIAAQQNIMIRRPAAFAVRLLSRT